MARKNFVAFIAIVFASAICCSRHSKHMDQKPGLYATLNVDPKKPGTSQSILVALEVKNNTKTSVTILDRPFIFFTYKKHSTQMFPDDLRSKIRADWRECEQDYVSIAPGAKLVRQYNFSAWQIMSNFAALESQKDWSKMFPMQIQVQYRLQRKSEDNFYYDFAKEGMAVSARIPIKAFVGLLESKIQNIEFVDDSHLIPGIYRNYLGAVFNSNVEFVTLRPKDSRYVILERKVKVTGPEALVELTKIGQVELLQDLVSLLKDKERAWAAVVVLSAMTGHESKMVDVWATRPEEWWEVLGKSAHKRWQAWLEQEGSHLIWDEETWMFVQKRD